LGPKKPGVLDKMYREADVDTLDAETIGEALLEIGQKIVPSAEPAEKTLRFTLPD